MKLPNTKKELYMLMGLFAVVIIAIIYLAQTLFAAPLLKSNSENILKIKDYTKKIANAEKTLRRSEIIEKENIALKSELDFITTNNFLRPTLGSYQISLEERLKEPIKKTGFKLETVKQLSTLKYPTSNDNEMDFSCCVAEIAGSGSYTTICNVLNTVLDASPAIHIAEIVIRGQGAQNPTEHNLSLRIEWPLAEQDKEAL